MPPRPHLLDDISVGLGDLALHPQRVGEVELVQVGAQQEVLGQRRSVAQTLRGGVGGNKQSERVEPESEQDVTDDIIFLLTSALPVVLASVCFSTKLIFNQHRHKPQGFPFSAAQRRTTTRF